MVFQQAFKNKIVKKNKLKRNFNSYFIDFAMFFFSDFQKLEREARICRKLQHPNIGE